jgi:nucleoid DNA-binding protein
MESQRRRQMINDKVLEDTIQEVVTLLDSRFNDVTVAEYIEVLQAVIDELKMSISAAQECHVRNLGKLMKEVTEQIQEDEL